MYRNYDEMLKARLDTAAPAKVAVVAGANDAHALEAVFLAQEKGYATPLLAGPLAEVEALVKELGFAGRPYEAVDAPAGMPSAEAAVRLIHEGRGDFIMKGRMETKDLLRPVLHKEIGLNKSGFITHFGCMQLRGRDRLLAISDCAVIPYPSLEDKEKIVKAGVDALCKLGYEKPVVGALCAVETVSDKMPETLDAQKLQERSDAGAFAPGVLVGPISYDLATSRESAAIKGYTSPYAGEVDMLLVPQMVTGNVMSKIWNVEPENILAGCLIGADVPIVLTSRSASMEEKLYSILLCAMLSRAGSD